MDVPSEIDNDKTETAITDICNYYKIGRCRHGASGSKVVNNETCKYLHPQKCKKYCNFGLDGCDSSCGRFHPVMCTSSITHRKCMQESCTLNHVLGTERCQRKYNDMHSKEAQNKFSSSYRPKRPFNTSKKQHKEKSNQNTNEHQQNGGSYPSLPNSFTYRMDDFPPIKSVYNKNITEMSKEMHEMRNLMGYLVHNSNSSSREQNINNYYHYPHTANIWNQGRTNDSNQHRTFTNSQHNYNEAKNFRVPHPAYGTWH